MMPYPLRRRLHGWRRQFPLIWHLARQELIDRHKGSLIGKAWTLISPLVNILVFVLVFSRIMGARLEGFGAEIDQYSYSIYLIIGILAWTAFAKSLSSITNVFSERAGVITKVKLSLKALPISVLIAEAIIYAIGMSFFMVFLWWVDFPFGVWWLGVPVVFALQLAFTYALGLLLAVLAVYLKDIREGVAVLLPVWFWTTPIVYVSDILPEWVMHYLRLNPLYHLIDAYRELIMYQRLPDIMGLANLLLLTLLLAGAAFWLLGRTERDLRDCL
ncbi:ABC transporter permease [Halomonas pacifica]|uniref:Transport permease protein n=1 Tax=Bisbaumannia pacifica TaxID=77098 RepID=A0A510XGL5_9GAMM|nr:ABC transporter permease [Halomonas pacifica]MDC8803666.1 ABC transporter permease [Halomonas pacifica]GEK48330.1 transport permease protein [Halomonas pacifica]